MDSNPTKKPKTRPFYKPPDNKRTSAEIIRDARSSVRSLQTTRPYTPHDEQRTLFGGTSIRNPETRPPSTFSLGSRHFDGSESRPVSGTRLVPLDHLPKPLSVSEAESKILQPKPPPDSIRCPARKNLRSRLPPSAGSDVKGSSTAIENLLLELHPSIDESTPSRLVPEERGEGDGKESLSRAPSSVGDSGPVKSKENKEARISHGGKQLGQSAVSNEEMDKLFYEQQVAPFLENLIRLKESKDEKMMCQEIDQFYNKLEQENLLGRNCKQRSLILKSVFKLLDVESAAVHLRLAQLILALRVSGNNLLSVCRLIFKVSKNEQNDLEFLHGNILDVLLQTLRSVGDLTSCSEALTYCVGALKLLTGNMTVMKTLVKKDCIETLATLLASINKNYEEATDNEQMGHILVQLTGTLRNLVDASSSRHRLLTNNVIQGLCQVMETYPDDTDLMLNIARILSKLTLHVDCCSALADQTGCYRLFLLLLEKHRSKEDLVVRVCFVLGNMTAKNENARSRLFQENGALDSLLGLLKTYQTVKKDSNQKEQRASGKNVVDIVEDILIKVVRVIANLAISESIGPVLAANSTCVELLLQVLETRDVEEEEELVLNTLATINNLSFYHSKTSAVTSRQLNIASLLLKMLLTDNVEVLVEAARVFGNLTQQKPVREFLAERKVQEILVTLLDSGNREVVYIACGVLVNFMADDHNRPTLKQEGGIKKLVDVLQDFGQNDWQLASVVCQVLWNYSSTITSTNNCFGTTEAQDLIETLEGFLDEDLVFSRVACEQMDIEVQQFVHDAWKNDFCPVAMQLIQRLESHQSQLEPLETPS